MATFLDEKKQTNKQEESDSIISGGTITGAASKQLVMQSDVAFSLFWEHLSPLIQIWNLETLTQLINLTSYLDL